GDAQPRDRGVCIRAESISDLGDVPDIETPLYALGVGVEGAVETSLRASHLAQDPLQGVDADVSQARVARCLPTVQICAREQGVVIEHLLKVGHRPGGVDAVA